MADTVVTSLKAARYHVDDTCAGWLQGRGNSDQRGDELHGVQRISEAEAIRQGKLACKRCGGR